MVWLNAADEDGNGLYLHVHRVERRGKDRFALHGTMGDGFYEGDILVEIGQDIEITFADAWLDPRALESFFFRFPQDGVKAAVREKATSMLFCIDHHSPLALRPRSQGRSSPLLPGEEERFLFS